MKTGIDRIDEERCRQISAEGWTAEHDDEHRYCELKHAARCYEAMADKQLGALDQSSYPSKGWPWAAKWWKPSELPARNLEKAGALYRAEAERAMRGDLPDRVTYAEGMNVRARICGQKIDGLNVTTQAPL